MYIPNQLLRLWSIKQMLSNLYISILLIFHGSHYPEVENNNHVKTHNSKLCSLDFLCLIVRETYLGTTTKKKRFSKFGTNI